MFHPVGQKFARNRSISYGFRDIDSFSFSAKIQDGRRKWRKLKFSPFPQDSLVPPYGLKIRSKSLYLVAKIEIFPLSTGQSCTTLRVKNSLKIALSRGEN